MSLILLAIATVAFLRRGTRDLTTRGTIVLFALVWALSLALYALPWIKYSRPDGVAWATIYGSIASFLAAAALTQRVGGSTTTAAASERVAAAPLHIIIVITAVLGYIGFAYFIRAINRTVGWTTLFTDLHAARKVQEGTRFAQEYGTVKVLTYFSGISLLLWTLALRERTFRGKWRLLLLIGPVVLVPYFFLGERLSLLTVFMWIVAFHLLWRPIQSPPRVAFVALAATLGALGFFFLIGYNKGATIQNHPELRTQLSTQHFKQLALPYLYLTANIPVFSKLTQDPIAPHTYGALTFWPAAKLSNLALQRHDYPPRYGAFYNIPFDAYNSASWLGPFYLDFRVPGSIVMPALFGLATTWLLVRAQRRRTLLAVWLAALGLMIIAFSPLKDAFSDANTWEFILMAPAVAFFATERSEAGSRQSRTSRLRRAIRRHPVLSGVGLATLSVLIVAAVALRLSASPRNENSTRAVNTRLRRAGEKLAEIYDREGSSSSSSPQVLATRLAVSDPAGTYAASYALALVPQLGVVDVFAKPQGFRLRARTSRGDVLEAIGVERDGEYRVAAPRVLRAGLVANGGFEEPLGRPWLISSPRRQGARITPDALDGAYSLSLRYRRPNAAEPTSVTQLVTRLPVHAPGTRYTLKERVLTRGLSRQVPSGLQFIYADRTSQYISGTTGTRAPATRAKATGILAGSRGPYAITASGVAKKRLAAIRIFAVDAGTTALHGIIVIDDVRLTAKKLSARR